MQPRHETNPEDVDEGKEDIGIKRSKDNGMEESWAQRQELYKLLKKYTSSEPRNTVMGVERDNGWEAWRGLPIRYESTGGIHMANKVRDLCTKSKGTSMVISEIGRRKEKSRRSEDMLLATTHWWWFFGQQRTPPQGPCVVQHGCGDAVL